MPDSRAFSNSSDQFQPLHTLVSPGPPNSRPTTRSTTLPDILKTLADNGQPLHVRPSADPADPYRTLLHRDDRPQILYGHIGLEFDLRDRLVHHPREVTVNDQPLPTRPPPALAQVTVHHALSRENDHNHLGTVHLEPGIRPSRFNALAAGVWAYLTPVRTTASNLRHRSPNPDHRARHHRVLNLVTLTTHSELEADELDLLTVNAQSGVPHIPRTRNSPTGPPSGRQTCSTAPGSTPRYPRRPGTHPSPRTHADPRRPGAPAQPPPPTRGKHPPDPAENALRTHQNGQKSHGMPRGTEIARKGRRIANHGISAPERHQPLRHPHHSDPAGLPTK